MDTDTADRQEAKPGLANYYHPVAWADEVEDKPLRVELLEEDLVLWRSGGEVVAMRDVCIHRGARLSLGFVADDCIVCPYHGWKYDPSGACVEIPSLPPGSPIPAKAKAMTCFAVERYGAIWVSLEEPVSDVPKFPGDQWEDPNWRVITNYKETWDTSAARMAENFNDWAHLPWVHTGLLAERDEAVTPKYSVKEIDGGLHHEIERLKEEDGKTVQVGVKYVFDTYFPFTTHLERTGPGISDDPDEVNLARMSACPHSPRRTTVFSWVGRTHGLEPELDEGMRAFERTIIEQDRPVVESQRPQEIPLDLREELHLKVPDAWSLAYRPWLAENLKEDLEYIES